MSQETALVEAAVKAYVDGIIASDAEKVRAAFHPDAVMTGHFGGEFMVIPKAGDFIADYMAKIPPTSEHSPDYAGRIVGTEQFDTLARVTLEENQLEGKDMRTVLILHKVGGTWTIASKGTWAPA